MFTPIWLTFLNTSIHTLFIVWLPHCLATDEHLDTLRQNVKHKKYLIVFFFWKKVHSWLIHTSTKFIMINIPVVPLFVEQRVSALILYFLHSSLLEAFVAALQRQASIVMPCNENGSQILTTIVLSGRPPSSLQNSPGSSPYKWNYMNSCLITVWQWIKNV